MHEKIRQVEIEAKQRVLDLFAGMYHSAFKGQGIEVEDIREYHPGDEVRAIAWSRTAKMGRPFVKNFREERDLTVMLVVDFSGSEQFGSHFETNRERMAEVGALLAFSAIYNHDRVGLILFSSDIELYIPPKRGLRHGMRLLRELLEFQPKKKGTSLAGALGFLQKVVRKRCIAFVLSDFQAPNFEKEFRLVSQKDDIVAIRIMDAEEKRLPPIGLVRMKDLETGEVDIVDLNDEIVQQFEEEQKRVQSAFNTLVGQSGADIIDISTEGEYYSAIHAFFKARRRLR